MRQKLFQRKNRSCLPRQFANTLNIELASQPVTLTNKGRTMIFTRLLLALVTITLSSQAFALSDEALFQHARDSYAAKNTIALTEDAAQLNTQQYIWRRTPIIG
jgi:hypothetical protein